MTKPNGVSLAMSDSGISMSVSRPSAVEDSIWDAVESAIDGGWTPEQFRNEVASAWKDRLKQDGEYAEKVFSR